MKKRLISLALVLLVLLSILPAAYADNDQNYYLGSYNAGQGINCYITDIDKSAQIGSVTMPGSTRLETEENGDALKLYFRGSIASAGSYRITLPIEGYESYKINLTVDIIGSTAGAATPRVSQSADISCKLGDTAVISVAASTSDGGTLSYQWYSAGGGRILGATGSTYYPNTYLVGTEHYYCEVTNTLNGSTATVNSSPIAVTVKGAAEVETISVSVPPDKLRYRPGEYIDTAGISLLVIYSDKTSKFISDGFEISPAYFMDAGRQRVTVSLGGRTSFFDVLVGTDEELVEGIGVVTLPDKTMYKVGDRLDVTGLVVRAYLKGNIYEDVDARELECGPATLNTSGKQTITVKYAGRTCTFEVNVEEDKTELAVASMPTKLEYTVGDKLDTAGLAIRIQQGGRTETVTSGFTCTPKVLTTAGTQEITVIYGGVNKCTFNVTVNEKNLQTSPSPSPTNNAGATATPKPSGKPTASAVPTPIRHESHNTNFAGTLVKVVLVIAMFSLVGLGAYVVVMRKKGKM